MIEDHTGLQAASASLIYKNNLDLDSSQDDICPNPKGWDGCDGDHWSWSSDVRRPRRDIPPGIPGQFLCVHAPIVFLGSRRIPRPAACEVMKFNSPKANDTSLGLGLGSFHFHRYLRKIVIKVAFNLIWIYFRAQIGWLGRGAGREGIAPWLETRGQFPGIPRHWLLPRPFSGGRGLSRQKYAEMWRQDWDVALQ